MVQKWVRVSLTTNNQQNTNMKNTKLKVREYSLEKLPIAVYNEETDESFVCQDWDIISENSERQVASVGFKTCKAGWSAVPSKKQAEYNRDRLIACWNACLGMDDPEAEVAAMKLKIEALEVEISNLMLGKV